MEQSELTYCPRGDRLCRHASAERLRQVQRVGIIKTGAIERRETVVELGIRCNDHGNAMAADLDHCPMDDLLPASAYPAPEENLLGWARRRGI